MRDLPTPQDTFARNLRRARERAGLSQEALADKAGVHRNAVALLEAGRRDVKLSTVAKLAKALKVDAGELIKGV
jgi:transcriptional regulator with XRE-family HTH domain